MLTNKTIDEEHIHELREAVVVSFKKNKNTKELYNEEWMSQVKCLHPSFFPSCLSQLEFWNAVQQFSVKKA